MKRHETFGGLRAAGGRRRTQYEVRGPDESEVMDEANRGACVQQRRAAQFRDRTLD